ncbi:MAG: sarcosine oxidase subunit delta, partial [Rhodospirillales bacterium]|nr:sarcosine oxidase subunit delta [Rhodospirillales bacterium]
MRITCPHCGERSVDEFATIGSAEPVRPESSTEIADWVDYVYVRSNPAGRHREWFHHVSGCRAWIVVTRDTRTHAIVEV